MIEDLEKPLGSVNPYRCHYCGKNITQKTFVKTSGFCDQKCEKAYRKKQEWADKNHVCNWCFSRKAIYSKKQKAWLRTCKHCNSILNRFFNRIKELESGL